MTNQRVRKVLAATLSLGLITYATAAELKRFPFMEVHDGRLYTQTHEGKYLALSLSAHRIVWRISEPRVKVFSKPAFVDDWLVLVADENSESEVLGLRDGEVRWRTPTGAAPMIKHSSPVACGEDVLVGDWWHSEVSALSVSSGRTKWRRGGTSDNRYFHPPAIRGSSAFYLSYRDPETTEIDEVSCQTGELLNAITVDGNWSTILLNNDAALLMRATDHTGTELASFDLRRRTMSWRFHIRDLVRSSPKLVGGNLVLAEENLIVIALDTGRILFRAPMSYYPGVAVVGDTLFHQSGDQALSAIDLKSHATLWKTTLPSKAVSNPVATGNSIYIRVATDRILEISAATGRVMRSVQLE
jgi:outer membrane protein assembly factor BamB